MGLRKILTTPIGFKRPGFSWNEPALYRIRLRNDLWLRVGVVLGCWAAGTGLFGLIFVNNVHQPGLKLAIGLGMIAGVFALLSVFLLRDHVSGSVRVDDEGVHRHRTFAGLVPGSWSEWQNWPFDAIDGCMLVHGAGDDHSFSTMLLSFDDETELIGIPGSVELEKLARYLTGKGVTVSQGKAVPKRFRNRLNSVVAAAVPVVGVVLLGVGSTALLAARQRPAPARPEIPGLPEPVARNALSVIPERPAPPQPITDAPKPGDPDQVAAETPRAEVAVTPPRIAASTDSGGDPAAEPLPPPSRPEKPPEPNPSPSDNGKSPAKKTAKTELVGGAGGFAFERLSPEGKPAVGFRSTKGAWSGKEWIGRFEPLFGGERETPRWKTTLAKPGYAVGGMNFDLADHIRGYSVIFMRQNSDGTLEPEDSYEGEWVGPELAAGEERQVRRLTGDGKPILGTYGRAGIVLDAVGLVYAAD